MSAGPWQVAVRRPVGLSAQPTASGPNAANASRCVCQADQVLITCLLSPHCNPVARSSARVDLITSAMLPTGGSGSRVSR